MATPPPVEDQARLLEEALGVVRQQAVLMRRCLEAPGKLMDALKCGYVLGHGVAPTLLNLVYQIDPRVRTANIQPRPQAVL